MKFEKWCIRNTHKYIGEWFNTINPDYDYTNNVVIDYYLHYPAYQTHPATCHSNIDIVSGYQKVDLRWFQENILKMKYTIQEIYEQKIAVICESHEEAQKLYKATNSTSNWQPYNTSGKYEIKINSLYKGDFNISWSYFQSRDTTSNTKVINFDQVDFMEKVQVGWNIKSNFVNSANKIIGEAYFGINKRYLGEYDFRVDSNTEIVFRNYNVLDIFCEPVYKEEKQPIDLVIGSGNGNGILVNISNVILVNGVKVNIYELKTVITTYENFYKIQYKINDWNVITAITDEQKIIKIGCSLFSLKELKEVIKIYEEWNK